MKQFVFLFFLPILLAAAVGAEVKQIIAYGGDLTEAEKTLVFQEFPLLAGIKPVAVKSVEVTNQEEWELFKGILPDSEIGTKAISSIYIEKRDANQGLEVEAKNITLITPRMFANAITTAGVKDAKIYATAPIPVSGTAALAGIYKSFENLTDTRLTTAAKRTAAQELVRTGSLGRKIGQERAVLLMEKSKEEVIKEQTVTREKILKIIETNAKEENVDLTEAEKKELTEIFLKIKELNLNLEQLQTQLKNFQTPTERTPVEKPRSWLDRFLAFIRTLFDQIFSFVGKIFS